MRIAQASPPSDVQLPPYARRLDVRATRAAFAAGTLGTVGDDVAREDGERYVVARDANRNDADDVKHGESVRPKWQPGMPTRFLLSEKADAEALRQARLRRWQAIR